MSHGYMGQTFKSGLAAAVPAQEPYEVAVEMSDHSHGCRQEDSIPCRLLAGGLRC